ncbi:FecR family protein [Chitinophaga nivalis]|uniref:FecR domain-containing protein n=1 Tax=Chitinophaga nivalis TaxID=2991709 RepID=A0ABT3IQW8_9BACT|nr:FecR domain-containing protein [Chitinophaga nivalis]MCW3463949.1 FecR domain-containing protein [Chitinophaga nivalis]MCW3486361.1 FecR domain-containing protein [Chitinophaga nivalis]
MTTQAYKALLQKYIQGNCTPAEKQLVAMMLADPAYQHLFEEALGEEGNPLEAAQGEPDEQMLLWTEKIHQRIPASQQPRRNRLLLSSVFRYAAVWIGALVMLSGLAYLIFNKDKPAQVVYIDKINNSTRPLRMMMPDSSVIIIGPGSKLSYPEVFAADTRHVLLDGEAFFDIKQDPGKPFSVGTGEIRTEVLGTAFKVTAFAGKNTTVAVASGKVRVCLATDSAAKELALLPAGRQVVYAAGKAALSETNITQLEAWQQGKLIYLDAALSSITADLERWYGVEVRYTNRERAGLLLNISLNAAAPLESTLRLIAATGNITYTLRGKTITIH